MGQERTAGHFQPIIERNCFVPISKVIRLHTVQDKQRVVEVKVYQGESPLVKDNIFLGKLTTKVRAADAREESIVEYLEKAVDKGNVNAAYQLAREYLSGKQLAVDYERARKLMELLASKRAPSADFWLSQFYEKGLGVPQDAVEAKRLLVMARKDSAPEVVNDFAWQLATNRNKELRNGVLAVELMEDVLADPNNVDAQWVDTLAAAYAEVGNFDKAIQTQRRAIDRLVGRNVERKVRNGFEERLKRYQASHSYVE